MSDPMIEPRWIKVRSLAEGWITLRMDCIAEIQPCGYGFSMRMLSGSLILMTRKEGQRVLNRILPEGIRP